MLPRLRSTIRLPADKHLLQQLEFCVRKLLCREKDKDVVATVRKVRYILTFCSLKKQEFKKINTFQIFFFFFSQTVLELDKMDISEPVFIYLFLSNLFMLLSDSILVL